MRNIWPNITFVVCFLSQNFGHNPVYNIYCYNPHNHNDGWLFIIKIIASNHCSFHFHLLFLINTYVSVARIIFDLNLFFFYIYRKHTFRRDRSKPRVETTIRERYSLKETEKQHFSSKVFLKMVIDLQKYHFLSIKNIVIQIFKLIVKIGSYFIFMTLLLFDHFPHTHMY